MNIYKYIRSKDVREYNEKIGHKFNTLESCFWVWRNPELTLNEKHEAWRHICLSVPDMEIKERLNVDYHPSLYELIEKFVATDKFFINEFYREEDKAIYQYRFYSEGDNGWCEDFRTPYSGFENMKKALEEDFDLPIVAMEYRKKYLDTEHKDITLSLKKDGTIMDVSFSGFTDDFLKVHYLMGKDEFFGGLWIDVPTPFKVGDIVCSKKTPFGYCIYNGSINEDLIEFMNLGHNIVLGDCMGADKEMQKLFAENGYPFVTVYYSGDRPRFNLGNWKTKHISSNKYLSDYERQKLKDNQMVLDSDFGYMLLQGQTKGTMANINKLLEENKTCYVMMHDKNGAYDRTAKVKKEDDLRYISWYYERFN